jgi:hypothetical protein
MARVGRNRERNKRMPKGWAPAASGVIYFRPTNASDVAIVQSITGGPKSIRLGATHDEAAETYARIIVAARDARGKALSGTVSEIVSRARLEIGPTITTKKTLKERERHWDELERLFGARRYARTVYDAGRATDGTYLRAMDVQRYIDDGRKTRPVAVNRAVDSWKLAFTWARTRWGLTEYDPTAGVMKNPEFARDVSPTDKMIFGRGGPYRRLTVPGRIVVAMYRYYGRRKGETVKLTLASEQKDGLHMVRGKARNGKSAKKIVLVWDPLLRRLWAMALRWRSRYKREGKVATTALLLNQRGRPYKEGTFNCDWRRAMEDSPMRGTFTVHDIRATRASTLPTLEDAQRVLAQDQQRTTMLYRRGPHVIDMNISRNRGKGFPKAASGDES